MILIFISAQNFILNKRNFLVQRRLIMSNIMAISGSNIFNNQLPNSLTYNNLFRFNFKIKLKSLLEEDLL